jgi:hypothetical protein
MGVNTFCVLLYPIGSSFSKYNTLHQWRTVPAVTLQSRAKLALVIGSGVLLMGYLLCTIRFPLTNCTLRPRVFRRLFRGR